MNKCVPSDTSQVGLIDSRTVILMTAVIAAMMALLMFVLIRRFDEQIRAGAMWTLGAVAYAVAFVGLGLRDHAPEFWAVVVANASLVAGAGFWLWGSQHFFRLPRSSWRWMVVAVAADAVANWWFFDVKPDYHARLASTIVLLVLIDVAHIRVLFKHGARTLPVFFTAAVLGVQALIPAVRAVTAFIPGLGPSQFFENDPIQILSYANFTFLVTFTPIGFLLIASDRLLSVLEGHATQDPLTGISNRRSLALNYATIVKQSGAYPHVLLLIDLDHFKSINDTYGHDVGDRVLVNFCRRVNDVLTSDTLFARLGGEEFVLVMWGVDVTAAAAQAERIRNGVRLEESGLPAVTCSIGVAVALNQDAGFDHLLRAADRALYAAKKNGRDRVELAEEGFVANAATDATAQSGEYQTRARNADR